MKGKKVIKLTILALSSLLVLIFAWLAFRPMPLSRVPPGPPAFTYPEEPQGFRVLAVMVDESTEELIPQAELGAGTFFKVELASPEEFLADGEPFWRAAMRRGLKAAVLFWPEVYPDSPFRADYTVAPDLCYGSSYLHAITLTEIISPWAGLPPSFSTPSEGVMEIRAPEGGIIARFRLLALDTVDDGVTSYDALVVEGGNELLHPGEWLSLEVDPHLSSGAFLKLLHLDRKKASLYQTPICYSYASPPYLLRELNEKSGFPPPPIDPQSLDRGWINREDALFLLQERAHWVAEAIFLVRKDYKADLMLVRLGLINEAAALPPGESSFLTQAYALTGETLKRLIKGMEKDEIMAVFSSGSRGFLVIHGGMGRVKVESPYPLKAKDLGSLFLSLLPR